MLKSHWVLSIALGVFACASWSVRGEEPAKPPQYEDTDAGRTIAAASADEAKIKFSPQKADAYLKNGALYWWAEKGCVTCHTNGIYGMERPSLTPVLGKPEAEVRAHFVEYVGDIHKLADDEGKALRESERATQVAVIARGLVEWDEHVTGRLSDESKKALSLMFEVQAPDGSWGNIECWPPYESSVFQGATVAVMAAATARNWLDEIASAEEKAKFQKALDYLRNTDPGHDYERLLRLWAATRAPSLLSDDEKQAFIEVVWKHQNDDGGWSMLDFYTFENWAAASRPRGFLKRADFDNARSDGHMTGLALLVLIDSGVDVKDKRIERGVEWLLANQRASGRWWTRSLNTDNYHFMTYSATAYALVALHKAGRLKKTADESEDVGRAGPVRFSEHLLADNSFGYVFGLAAADLDGDGDLDLTHADIQNPNNNSKSTLYWYHNDGKGNFNQQIIFKGEPGWFERHTIGDIDGNGTLDVAIVNNEKGTLIWFENSGKPAAGPWRRRVISNDCPKAYNVTLADFDGDGDLDAGAVGYTSNHVSWYENPGKDQLDRQWTRRVIDGAMQEARTIATGDFNRDGKIDLLAAAVGAPNAPKYESQVVWYENPGEPAKQEWTRRIISKELPAAIHGHPVDLDGDGDLDVVMAHGMRMEADPQAERHQVVWYENIGKPRATATWKRHNVGLLPYAFEAIAGDIDGDGDLDIAATAWAKGDRVVWFENSGDGRWSQHVVRTDFRAANSVILADLDGDGRLDIVASADDGSGRVEGSREVRWWRNDGRAPDFVPSKPFKAATPVDFNKFRKILVSPTVNTPEPFKGFGGWCGWPDVCRLKNGDLFVTFSAGYYHASWPTPLDMPPELKELYSKHVGEWLFEWDCPTGGQTMWIRSRDNGKTWTRPRAFPETRGGYYASDVIQLRDGTMLASVRVSPDYGYWPRMPATPLEFARTAANRLDQHNRVFRSDDNGETWRAVGRVASFGWNDGVYSFCESPDDSVLAIYNFSPIPDGPGWNGKNSRWLTAVARSSDKGTTWKTLSITGSNDFNSFESTGGYLPDGRIGFITRAGSHWFESSDHGRTWSQPKQVFPLVNGKPVGFARGELQVLPNGVVAVVFCDLSGNHGQLIYSRDNGENWIKPAEERGFQFDPLAYYPDACVLEDGSLFVVGCHEGLGKNKYGPAGAEVTSMRFRIKDANEGKGIELLPIGDR